MLFSVRNLLCLVYSAFRVEVELLLYHRPFLQLVLSLLGTLHALESLFSRFKHLRRHFWDAEVPQSLRVQCLELLFDIRLDAQLLCHRVGPWNDHTLRDPDELKVARDGILVF